jgi:DNA-binding transcriptional regulator YiaG
VQGNELRRWREAHNISQSELAQWLGVRQHTVSRWETGVSRMPEVARRLLDVLRPVIAQAVSR